MSRSSRLIGAGVAALLAATALAGCSSSAPAAEAETAPTENAAAESWPRTFENADGTTTEIPAQPESIASTSVTVTGTLLAIGAPVTASGAAGNGKFFAQWADIAQEEGVSTLWPAGEVDLEAVHGAAPDLIVVSTSGADSVADQVAQLQEIAPTIVVDYGGQTWEQLAEQLGEALGMEKEAEETVSAFDAYVADAATKITVPAGAANIVSYNGAGEDNPIGKTTGPHAKLLQSLGFTIEEPDAAWHTQANQRQDFVFASFENLTQLTGETTFALSVDNEGAKALAADPVLANIPSVKAGQVYGLGANSFRVDKYSATEIVDGVVANFAK
ncbi:Fe2+-enterobactin ABC transporter substrate-binding protein [Microbacterium gorillae]|uniref:Fe2+-enterobactin ABC transporter substrate-binding protein n=1 Tax=Microbacterium gorillae TaxID=1231063 RepID=UPI001E501839|nr:Fe2+-enterobactin ABC transporter substrate-binding protein [Microbacterium gorillae]